MAEDRHDAIEELLPAYALNALDPEERALVEAALEREPRYQTVLAEYLETSAQLSGAHAPAVPGEALRQRVLSPTPVGVGTTASREHAATRRAPPRAYWAIAAALVVAFLGLGTLALAQQQRVGDLEEEMDSLVVSAEEAEDGLRVQRELSYLVAQQAVAPVGMWSMATPQPLGDTAAGMILVSPDGAKILMAMHLEPVEPGMTYQVWLWDFDNHAYSVALFETERDGYALVRLEFPEHVTNARSVSISVEPEGGSDSPRGRGILAGRLQ